MSANSRSFGWTGGTCRVDPEARPKRLASVLERYWNYDRALIRDPKMVHTDSQLHGGNAVFLPKANRIVATNGEFSYLSSDTPIM